MKQVIPPSVAGLFYPADPEELREMVRGFLQYEPELHTPELCGLIAPHAGYIYSGMTAGAAYALLRTIRREIHTVILLGPAHRSPIDGMAVPAAEGLSTPLGTVAIAEPLRRLLLERSLAQAEDRPFRGEHCLEVQLPFLQESLRHFEVVPILIGAADPEQISIALSAVITDDAIVVVSSDLSHYLSDALARQVDAETTDLIETLAFEQLKPERACGAAAIRGLLHYARGKGLRAAAVRVSNSGDVSGDKQRVVGYGAYAFTREQYH